MTSATDLDRVILTIDLRDTDPAKLTRRRFSEVQAERAPDGDARRVDFGRVILIDDAAGLTAHHEVYAHILDSHVDVSLLCLAIGPGPEDDPTVAVRRPFQVGPPKAATLWVGDLYGIGWRMESTQADQVHFPGQVAEADALSGILEVLRLPQIFDRVLDVVGSMPGGAACPGIRVFRGDIDPYLLADAQRAAIRRLTDPGSGADDLLPSADARHLFDAPGQQPSRISDVIRPGGMVDEMFKRCRRAGHDAVLAVGRMTGPRGLFRVEAASVRAAFGRLADALSEFTEAVSRALDWADPRTGFEDVHREQLDQLGIELTRARPAGTAYALEALDELTLTALDRCRSLPAIAERLRGEADKAVPQGTGPYLDRLNRICSADMLSRLRTPPAFLPSSPSPGLLVATFVVCLLSGLWPRPVALCGSIAVLGVLLGIAWLRSRAAPIAAASARAGWRFALSQLAAALAGSLCGVGLSRVFKLPGPAGLIGVGVGAGTTVVLVLALILLWWSALGRRWSASMRLIRLSGTADALRALVAEVARDEWQVAEERVAVSDYARIMAGIMDDAADGLRSYAAGLPDPDSHGHAGGRRHDYDQVSQDLALYDLADAVADTVRRIAATLDAGRLTMVDGATVQHELTAALSTYRGHLAAAGLHERPPFGRASEQRSALVRSLMERGSDMQELSRSDVRDERIIQLCAPEQLMLLETQAATAELIKFAPRAAQDFVGVAFGRRATAGAGTQGRPIEWTAASPVVGVVRLVPLRASAVCEVWPATEDISGPVGDTSGAIAGTAGSTEQTSGRAVPGSGRPSGENGATGA
jgi:hypothetical protein